MLGGALVGSVVPKAQRKRSIPTPPTELVVRHVKCPSFAFEGHFRCYTIRDTHRDRGIMAVQLPDARTILVEVPGR